MSSESLNLGGGLLTDEQIDEFKEAFDMFDKDGEGTIGPDEFTDPTAASCRFDELLDDSLWKGLLWLEEHFDIDNAKKVAECGVDHGFTKLNENGVKSPNQRSMMKTLGLELTEKEVLLLLQEVDEDKSGEIEFEEMLSALVRNMRETTIEEQMEEAYRTFDRDDKGYIDSKDLSRVVCELGENDVTVSEARVMMQNTLDGRDKVTKREFMVMLKMSDDPST